MWRSRLSGKERVIGTEWNMWVSRFGRAGWGVEDFDDLAMFHCEYTSEVRFQNIRLTRTNLMFLHDVWG